MAANTPTIEPTTVPSNLIPNVGQLSFTGQRSRDDGINLWDPAALSNDWNKQCRQGRDYGIEFVEYVRQTDDAAALGGIVRAILDRGTFGGVEVGFFAAISEGLLA